MITCDGGEVFRKETERGRNSFPVSSLHAELNVNQCSPGCSRYEWCEPSRFEKALTNYSFKTNIEPNTTTMLLETWSYVLTIR